MIKLEGSVYGLRTAPKAWFDKVAADLKKLGAKQHPHGPMCFMFFTKGGEVMGAIGVYVDDFLFIESELPEWKAMMKKIKALYSWGEHDYSEFILCGTQYRQNSDFSICLDQRGVC